MLTRLGPDGAALSTHVLPDGGQGASSLHVLELERLADGRVVAVADGVEDKGPLVVFEVADTGLATAITLLDTAPSTPFVNMYAGVSGADLSPTPDGGWVMVHELAPLNVDDECATYLARHAPDGSVQWSLEHKGPTGTSAAAVMVDGRIVASWGAGLLVVAPDGQVEAKLEFTDFSYDTAEGLAPAPNGGVYAYRESGRLHRLGADLQPLRARNLPDVVRGFQEPLHRGPDGALLLWASYTESVLMRLTHDGRLLGSCASGVLPDTIELVDAPYVDVWPTDPVSSSPFAWSSTPVAVVEGVPVGRPATVCSDPAPRLVPQGGQVGGTLVFQHEQPCCPGGLSLMVLGASGTGSLPLPNGLDVGVLLDPLGFALLQAPSLSFAVLDGAGTGSTASFPIPADPGLVGAVLTHAGIGFELGASSFAQVTVPTTLVLQ